MGMGAAFANNETFKDLAKKSEFRDARTIRYLVRENWQLSFRQGRIETERDRLQRTETRRTKYIHGQTDR